MTLVNVIAVVLVIAVLALTLAVRRLLKRKVEDAEGFEGVNSDGQFGKSEEGQIVFKTNDDGGNGNET